MSNADLIRDLFIIRSDTYAQQGANQYIRVESELTNEIIQLHLSGEITIGSYQLNKESKCKWICFDFDGTNLEEQFNYNIKL